HYPVPVLHLPEALGPYAPRLAAMAQSLTALRPNPPLALATYQAAALQHPALMGAYAPPEFYGQPAAHHGPNMAATIWKLFKKRMPLILGLVLLTEIGITVFTIKSPKTYVADTTLNSGIASKDPLSQGGDWFTQGTVIANLTSLITSRTVLSNTISALGLHTTPDKLADQVKVTRIGATALLQVEADADTPEQASDLANTLVRQFLQFYIASQTHEARSNKSFFETQVDQAAAKLDQAEAKLKAFKATNVPELAAGVPQHVSDLQAQRDEAVNNLAASRAALATVEHEIAKLKADPMLRERVMGNAAVMTSGDKLRLLQQNLQDAISIYGKNSSVVSQLKTEIARAKANVNVSAADALDQNPALADAMTKRVGLMADISSNEARLSALNSALAKLEPQARSASTNAVTYDQLQRDVTIAAAHYQDLATKYDQSNLLAQGAANLNISVVDPAIPPRKPLDSKLGLKLVLGFILSLGLGLFISYLMSLREQPEAEAEPAAPGTKLLRPGLSA
ncbi:MAG TPA: GNVR domain-containing protein, partial [Oscillatoriaceae cyanobacterium]